MQFSITINQVFCVKHDLNLPQSILFSFLANAHTWAGQFEINGHSFCWVAYQKIITELPVLGDKPDTIKRLMLALEKKGLIERAVFNNNSVFRILEIGEEWYKNGREINPEGREIFPDSREKNTQQAGKKSTEVGKKIPEGREIFPDNQYTNNQYTNNHNNNITTDDVFQVPEKTHLAPIENKTPKPKKQKTTYDAAHLVKTYNANPQVATDWLTLRKVKKLPVTASALSQLENEAAKAGITVAEAIAFANGEGWGGFKANWYAKRIAEGEQPVATTSTKQDKSFFMSAEASLQRLTDTSW